MFWWWSQQFWKHTYYASDWAELCGKQMESYTTTSRPNRFEHTTGKVGRICSQRQTSHIGHHLDDQTMRCPWAVAAFSICLYCLCHGPAQGRSVDQNRHMDKKTHCWRDNQENISTAETTPYSFTCVWECMRATFHLKIYSYERASWTGAYCNFTQATNGKQMLCVHCVGSFSLVCVSN